MMHPAAKVPVLVSLALATLSLACRGPATPIPAAAPSIPASTPAPLPTPASGPMRPPLEIAATPRQAQYLPGERVKIEFSFSNRTSEPISVKPFPPAVDIRRPRPYQTVWSSPAGTGVLLLNPQETATHILEWDQRDSTGQQAPPGYYNVDVSELLWESLAAERSAVGGGRTAASAIALFLVQFPQGAMEKTIEVDQSQTANGVTITLKRVELSSQGARAYAFVTPPGYSLPQGPLLPPPKWMVPAAAQYSLDGGQPIDGGYSAIRHLPEGMELIWDNLDPVPRDAREMTFTITRLGDLSGRWEFRIALR